MARKRNSLPLNDLPDNILCLILGKIPLKEAVRCSVVSKKWRFFWTFRKNLKFAGDLFSSSSSVSQIENRIDRILKLHSGQLEVLEVNNARLCCTSQKISDWIHQVACKGLQEIKMEGKVLEISEIVPTAIFLCQSLRSVTLRNFVLTNLPDGFGGFTELKALNLYKVQLNDKIIELMLQLCPGLEVLNLHICNGFERLKICSQNLVALSISSEIKAITANCPRLLSLITLLGDNETLNILLGRMEIKLDLPVCLSLCTNTPLEPFAGLRTLRRITSLRGIVWSSLKILTEFPDLEEMCINKCHYWSGDFSGHDDEVLIQLENLKRVHLNITNFNDPVPLLTCLFRIAPALKTLLVARKKGFDGPNAMRYINLVMNLQKPSTETKIFLSRNTADEERCIDCNLVFKSF
ncbi:hypothetical protein SUGI_0346610 [Cryptomeria japonica]|uniref:F-box/FBD/LRR-repeat protein At1g13570-like n=1 Tax=Cryptomeria japonica TaxID=3369 RepID=UPI0024089D54|nr:F-box/FBD/LRR-repeat protein At1g13570-like [Cryptomeria japonica]GLJ19269.1 hypothetical protein SUGI_0346610 [Cryptomeria japonica]